MLQPTSVTLDWNFGDTAVLNSSVVFYADVTITRIDPILPPGPIWYSTKERVYRQRRSIGWSSTNAINTLTGLTPQRTYVFYLQIRSFDKTERSVNYTITTREFI